MTELGTIGAYIHIPFCESKCDYCDFYSIVADERLREKYVQELQQEIINSSEKTAIIDTIYFGGGNPGLLLPEQISRLIQTIEEHHVLTPNAEITMECNPETANAIGLKALRNIGVNRISFGVQTYNIYLLETIGRPRRRPPEEILTKAIEIFPQVSLDLMMGLPGQTLRSVQDDVERLPKNVGHISVYDLTLYPKTRLAKRVEKGEVRLNDEEVNEALEEKLFSFLKKGGYSQYEVSNFSKPQQQSKHNLHYWHYDDYRGFGAGAVSSFQGTRVSNAKLPQYLLGNTIAKKEILSVPIQKLEWLLMNLRLTDGFKRGRYERRFGLDVVDEFPSVFGKQREYFNISSKQIALTEKGLRFHHTVLSDFVV